MLVLRPPNRAPDILQALVSGCALLGGERPGRGDPLARFEHDGRQDRRDLPRREGVEQARGEGLPDQDVAFAVDARQPPAALRDRPTLDVPELLQHPEHAVELPRERLGSCSDPALDPVHPAPDVVGPTRPTLVLTALGTRLAGMGVRALLERRRLAFDVWIDPWALAVRGSHVEVHQPCGGIPPVPGASDVPASRQRHPSQD